MKTSLAEFIASCGLSLGVFATTQHGDLATAGMLGAVCIALIVIGAMRLHGLMHPLTLLLGASGAYIASGTTELLLFPNLAGLSAEPAMAMLAHGSVFLVGARFSGDALVDRIPESGPPRFRACDAWFGVPSIWIATAAAAGAAFAEAWMYGLDIGSISRAEIYANEPAVLSASRIVAASLVVIGYAAWRSLASRGTPPGPLTRIGFLLAVVLMTAAELLILGDRRLLMSMFLGIGCAHGIRRVPWLVLVGAVPALALLLAYGFVRNRPVEQWSEIFDSLDALQALSPSNLEFGGFLVVAEYVLPLPAIPDDFPHYQDALLQMVPKSVWPDRPEAPSEWFVRTFFPDQAVQGYGYGFNAIVESLLNLGPAGPALLGVASGAVLVLAGRSRVTAGLAAFLAVFLMRLDLASLLRTSILAVVACTVALAVSGVVRTATSSAGAIRSPSPQARVV